MRAAPLALALLAAGCAAPRPAERPPPVAGADTTRPPVGWNPEGEGEANPEGQGNADPGGQGSVHPVGHGEIGPDGQAYPVDASDLDAAWAGVDAVVLATPPWAYTLADDLGRRAVVVPRLTRLLEAPNAITDDAAWLQRNGFGRPGDGAPSRALPVLYRDAGRLRVIEQDGWTLGIYGTPSAGRYLLAAGDGGARRAFDFGAYLRAPALAPGETGTWEQGLSWAALADGRLYVSHAHATYAVTTGGLNAYVTALDFATGALRWRSRPLVANAATFEVVGDALVTGYGFTAEPDALFVLDRYTGAVLHEARVRTAATWILRRDDRLFVRAYDADYVFALR